VNKENLCWAIVIVIFCILGVTIRYQKLTIAELHGSVEALTILCTHGGESEKSN
jgi:hypothetical protein